MKHLTFLPLAALLSASACLYSCSNSTDNSFGPGTGGNGSGSTGGGTGKGLGSGGTGSTPGLGVGGGGGVQQIASTDACGATDVAAEPIPVYMVFVYDRSASMGVNNYVDAQGVTQTIDNTAIRWTPVKEGVIDFFSNAGTKNVQASIVFFAAPGDKAATCAHDYSVPDVPMTRLETPTALVTGLNNEQTQGGTPTLPAVVGGIKYAKKLLTDNPGSEAIVVLVTDGEPAIYNAATAQVETDCAPAGVNLTNTIPDISTYVAAASDPSGATPVKTHVIGIGDATSIGSMKQVATAGRGEFIQVTPGDATATRTAILDQLTKIQPKSIACKVAIPSTKAGFNPQQVNVNFVHGTGAVDELSRSDSCPGAGWRYDNTTTPKYIELCQSSCDAMQQDLSGSLKIVLGCPTRVIL